MRNAWSSCASLPSSGFAVVPRPRRSQRFAGPGLAAADGQEMQSDDWAQAGDPVFAALIGHPGRAHSPLLMLFNASAHDQPFRVPGGSWQALLDSSEPTGSTAWQAIGPSTSRSSHAASCCSPLPATPSPPRIKTMRLPRASGVLLHPTSLPVRTEPAIWGLRPTTSSTGWSRRAEALADPAPGRYRRGQLALHEQFGVRRQPAAGRLGRVAPARLAQRRRPAAGLSLPSAAGRIQCRDPLPHGAARTGRCCVCGARHTARTGRVRRLLCGTAPLAPTTMPSS